MKAVLFLFLIFLTVQIVGQNDSTVIVPNGAKDLCEVGYERAIQYSDAGIYQVFWFGYPSMSAEEWRFYKFYVKYLSKNYNILYYHQGCVVRTDKKCYSNKMKEIILKKYGDDFFIKAKIEARNQYNINIQIDTGYVFSSADTLPQFIGGEDSLFKFLGKNMKYPNYGSRDVKLAKGTVYCQFIIEKDGSVSNIKLLKSLDPRIDNDVLTVMKKMPKWKPAKINNQSVRCKMILPFKFELN